ncbi:hypothetical protein [Gracilimonas mengyeensis]|nr:hypothetical protein [Gracilimonas mengyeensis]
MKYTKQLILLIFGTLLFVSCDNHFPGESRDFKIGEEFDLRVGQLAETNGASITIQFMEILEDSRCPASLMCFWAGNAKVSMKIAEGNSERMLELNTHPDMKQSEIFQGYKLQLIALNPYPQKQYPSIPKEDYRATLRVDLVD